ncbi:hypothetical protein NUACC26_098430 [Scytonema sp. NUACC26]
MARIEQGTERADLFAEFENLVCDALRSSRYYETLDAPPGCELGIRLVGKVAHHVQRAGLRKLRPHDVEVEAVGTVLAIRIATRRNLVIGHEDAARHAPPRGIDGEARRASAFQVALDLRADDVCTHVGRRDSGPAARSGSVRPLSIRPDRCGPIPGLRWPPRRRERPVPLPARADHAPGGQPSRPGPPPSPGGSWQAVARRCRR